MYIEHDFYHYEYALCRPHPLCAKLYSWSPVPSRPSSCYYAAVDSYAQATVQCTSSSFTLPYWWQPQVNKVSWVYLTLYPVLPPLCACSNIVIMRGSISEAEGLVHFIMWCVPWLSLHIVTKFESPSDVRVTALLAVCKLKHRYVM